MSISKLFFFILLLTSSFAVKAQYTPSLVYPSNAESFNSSTIIFSWDTLFSTNTLVYEIEVGTNSSFTSSLVNQLNINSNSFSYTFSSNIIQYYWRVRSFDGVNNSSWSTIRTFYICNISVLPNLKVWLKASEGFILNGNSISSWQDQSGNNINANQSTTSNQPSILTTELNGYNILKLGNNDYLNLGNSLNGIQNFSIFSLFNKINVTQSGVLYGALSGGGSSTFSWGMLGLKFFSGNGGLDYSFGNGNSFSGGISNSNIISNNQYYVSSQTHLKNQTFDILTLNGNSISTSPVSSIADSVINDNTLNFSIGRAGDYSPSFYLNGNIAEFIIFNTALSSDSSIIISNYLKSKYFPAVNLGANKLACIDTFPLIIPNIYDSIIWSTGTVDTNRIDITANGSYWVRVVDKMKTIFSDTVEVYGIRTIPNYLTPTNSIVCLGDTLNWNTNLNALEFNFLWNDNSTNPSLLISQFGNYNVILTDTNGCVFYSDTLSIAIDSFPVLTTLGPDKIICQGASLGLQSSTNPIDYQWSTGDTLPEIVVNTAGQYWLQNSNINGCTSNDTINITLNGIAPTTGFYTQKQCINEITEFTDTSFTTDGSNIISWSWDFGDGTTSTQQHPTHQYLNNISYTISLTITTDSSCVNTTTRTIIIHQKPIAGFFPLTNPICANQLANFSNNSFSTDGIINAWNWDFGDIISGDTSTLQHPSYVFSTNGNYNTSLIVTTQYNCSDTISSLINVKSLPIPSFTIGTACVNNSVLFTNTSTSNLLASYWDFDDGNFSALFSPSHNYLNAGNYNVQLINNAVNGCNDTIVNQITINENPIAKFDSINFCVLNSQQLFDSSTTNAGGIISWSWSVVGHNFQSNNQNPSFTFSESDIGSYVIQLNVSTDLGCKDSLQKTIVVSPQPKPDFIFNPTFGGPPLPINFTNQTTDGGTYLWNFGDSSSSSLTNPTHTYLDSSTYVVQLIAENSGGCIDSISKSIRVIDPLMDIALIDVKTTIVNTNFYQITATIINLGTFNVVTFNITSDTPDNGKVLEIWEGKLSLSAQMSYTFTSSFEIINDELPDLICVKITKPNGISDDVISNNEICLALSKFEIISIFPTPASNYLNIEYIVPKSEKTIIRLYNSIGKLAQTLLKEESIKGLNRYKFDVSALSGGIYFLEIEYDGNRIKEKILIE